MMMDAQYPLPVYYSQVIQIQCRHMVSANFHVGLFTNILPGVSANYPLGFGESEYIMSELPPTQALIPVNSQLAYLLNST